MNFIGRILLVELVLSTSIMHAAELPKPGFKPLEPLTAELELGIITTSGNTDSASLKGKATVKQDFVAWKNKYQLDTLYKRSEYDDESVTSAHKLFLSAQSDYKLTGEHSSVFVYGSYTDDRLSGYDYQNTVSVGYSGRLFSNRDSFLDYSVGPGYAVSKTDDGDKEESAIVHVEAEYQYDLSPAAKFTQTLSTEAALDSSKNTQSKSETAISVKLKNDLSMKASYSVTHNSKVLSTREKVDTVTSVTFAYSFR